jgi:hypothetical protein
LLVSSTALAGTKTYDQAVDKVFASGYPKMIQEGLDSLGTWEGTGPISGYRYAGSTADNAAAEFLAKELRKLGLKNVRLEWVPVDSQNFKGASVTVGSRFMPASTWGGVPPTNGPVSGEIVYAGWGTKAEFDALEARGVDIAGKIVLIDLGFGHWQQFNMPAAEAVSRGAKAIVETVNPLDTYYFGGPPDCLGNMDGYWQTDMPSIVMVARKDGDWLKSQIAAGTTVASVENKGELITTENGGGGYNVYAEIPGRVHPDELVVITAHHDAFFRAGLDDTGGVVQGMSIAKAMKTYGYKPERTVVFLFTTGEEWGKVNSYYDWCIGAWWAVTHTHADWPGRVVADLNLESMALSYSPVRLRVTHEFIPLVDDVLAANPDLWPYGKWQTNGIHTWNDQWTFTAGGIPTLYFSTTNNDFRSTIYHTQYDNASLQDYGYLEKLNKLIYRFAARMDEGLVPYALSERANHLASKVNAAQLLAADANPDAVSRLTADVADFQAAAAAFDAAKASIPAKDVPEANDQLMQIEKMIHTNFTALDAWDTTIYPHEQVMWDVEYLKSAIQALGSANTAAALTALSNIDLTLYGINFSHDVYAWDLTRHAPGFEGLYFAEQGRLAPFLDVMSEYNAIEGGTWNQATVASLNGMRAAEVTELNSRVNAMSDALEQIVPAIEALD